VATATKKHTVENEVPMQGVLQNQLCVFWVV